MEIISCPTCARCKYELFDAAKRLRQRFAGEKRPLKVAVMGCVVNGPGEAKHADLGIAGGGNGTVVLFAKGERLAVLPEDAAVETLWEKAQELLGERENGYVEKTK